MNSAPEPNCRLALWQFSLKYEDLPLKERSNPVDNGIYRSRNDAYVWVFHAPSTWDCFVPG